MYYYRCWSVLWRASVFLKTVMWKYNVWKWNSIIYDSFTPHFIAPLHENFSDFLRIFLRIFFEIFWFIWRDLTPKFSKNSQKIRKILKKILKKSEKFSKKFKKFSKKSEKFSKKSEKLSCGSIIYGSGSGAMKWGMKESYNIYSMFLEKDHVHPFWGR